MNTNHLKPSQDEEFELTVPQKQHKVSAALRSKWFSVPTNAPSNALQHTAPPTLCIGAPPPALSCPIRMATFVTYHQDCRKWWPIRRRSNGLQKCKILANFVSCKIFSFCSMWDLWQIWLFAIFWSVSCKKSDISIQDMSIIHFGSSSEDKLLGISLVGLK